MKEQRNVYKQHPQKVLEMYGVLKQIVAEGRSTPGPREHNDHKKINLWRKDQRGKRLIQKMRAAQQ